MDGQDRKKSEVVWEGDELIGSVLWGARCVPCPVCAGSGRRLVGEGEIAVRGWRGRRLRRARLLRCSACRGAGLIAH